MMMRLNFLELTDVLDGLMLLKAERAARLQELAAADDYQGVTRGLAEQERTGKLLRRIARRRNRVVRW